ncbi:MAG: peptidase M16 [Flavobacteriales bacterium CG18_big_fil_WC_8_21_14_2_50_32_9]|nr:MAG: peptidase M16 [Flavobacteriales bacterium CG18_big_fil_WC_8_21_14_2_50_32_9]PJC62184.1 MAG: peptidase M16 [Flavobacteriales bacterium CG_4_9_14_0_2_um_filter_32_27]
MKHSSTLLLALIFITSLSAQKLDRSKKPAAGPAPQINIGTPATFTLPNGLKVFVVENHKLPRVAFSLSLDVDPVLEGDMAGYVDATGQLLERGTKNRTKQQLDEEIDFIGASISTSSKGVYAASLKKHQDKLLNIMSDIILNSDFKQEELTKIITQTKSGLASSKDDPDAIASNVKSVLLYGKKHPYGEVVTEESIEKATLEQCKKYYNTYFKPNVAYLAIVGDVTVAEIKPLIEKYFANWEKADVPVNKYKTPTAPSKTRVAFVHKEGATQSVVNITYPINLKQNNPDVIKAQMMNSILGGSATARLFMNLRETYGYTYGAYSRISADEIVGNFNAFAKVRNEVTDSALTQFMIELNRIVDEKVTEEELQNIKNYMSGTFAYSLQDPQTVARFAINTEKYKLPADYYATYLKQIAAVTVDDIKEMAEKYIKPSNALILIVGDKKTAEKLTSFDAENKVSFYDTYGNDFIDLKPAPAGITAKTVIDNYIVAKYGLSKGKALDKKLKGIKDITVKMDATIQGQTISVTRYQKAPNKFANAMAMGTMVIQKQTFNGTTGKISGMQGNKDVTGDDLDELKLSSILFLDTKYDENGITYELIGVEPINGKDAYKMIQTKPNGDTETEWYDVVSNLKVKSLSVQENEQLEEPITVITELSDYKAVNGIQFAHKTKQAFGPQALDMVVTSIEINTKLGDEVFE